MLLTLIASPLVKVLLVTDEDRPFFTAIALNEVVPLITISPSYFRLDVVGSAGAVVPAVMV